MLTKRLILLTTLCLLFVSLIVILYVLPYISGPRKQTDVSKITLKDKQKVKPCSVERTQRQNEGEKEDKELKNAKDLLSKLEQMILSVEDIDAFVDLIAKFAEEVNKGNEEIIQLLLEKIKNPYAHREVKIFLISALREAKLHPQVKQLFCEILENEQDPFIVISVIWALVEITEIEIIDMTVSFWGGYFLLLSLNFPQENNRSWRENYLYKYIPGLKAWRESPKSMVRPGYFIPLLYNSEPWLSDADYINSVLRGYFRLTKHWAYGASIPKLLDTLCFDSKEFRDCFRYWYEIENQKDIGLLIRLLNSSSQESQLLAKRYIENEHDPQWILRLINEYFQGLDFKPLTIEMYKNLYFKFFTHDEIRNRLVSWSIAIEDDTDTEVIQHYLSYEPDPLKKQETLQNFKDRLLKDYSFHNDPRYMLFLYWFYPNLSDEEKRYFYNRLQSHFELEKHEPTRGCLPKEFYEKVLLIEQKEEFRQIVQKYYKQFN